MNRILIVLNFQSFSALKTEGAEGAQGGGVGGKKELYKWAAFVRRRNAMASSSNNFAKEGLIQHLRT